MRVGQHKRSVVWPEGATQGLEWPDGCESGRLPRLLALVLDHAVDEHLLDALGKQVERRSIHQDKIGVLAGLEAANAIGQHHGPRYR